MTLLRKFVWFVLLCLVLNLSSCGKSVPLFGTPQLLCFGDSITKGYKLAHPETESYPEQLQKIVGGDFDVLNRSMNGATVTTDSDLPIRKQKVFKEAMLLKPDVVVILLGTNDTKDGNWKFRKDFVEDYNKLTERFQTMVSLPDVYLCTLPPIFVASEKKFADRVETLTSDIRQVAAVHDLKVIDISDVFADRPDLFIDGVHPNAEGAKVLAEAVAKGIGYKKD